MPFKGKKRDHFSYFKEKHMKVKKLKWTIYQTDKIVERVVYSFSHFLKVIWYFYFCFSAVFKAFPKNSAFWQQQAITQGYQRLTSLSLDPQEAWEVVNHKFHD